MSWFFEIRERHSDKNGLIRARRDFGTWNVSVENCGQTSPYLDEMWGDAFNRAEAYFGMQSIKSVLMLGLGAGGEVAKIRKRFPNSKLTVVEYDEEMIALAKELKLYKPAPFPEIICDDAATAVPELKGEYDLIIVDMFKGPAPSALSKDAAFLSALASKLSRTGFMLVNVYKGAELFPHIAKHFLMLKQWKFEFNHIGFFTSNALKDAVADGYLPVYQWPDFNPLLTMSDFKGSSVAAGAQTGVYWRFGPFSFEKYYGDTEPTIMPLPKEKRLPIRIIMWQRLLRSDTPEPWSSFGGRISHKIGIVKTDGEYMREWSETAKRYLKKWKNEFQDSVYAIEEVAYKEFADAYLKTGTVPSGLRGPTLWEIRMRMQNPLTSITFTVARNKRTGKIASGMACMQSSKLPLSYYMAGFITKRAGNDPVMTGLFDHWFKRCRREGIRYADFGGFWWKGKDNSWKGLSLFKGKFGPMYLFYPAVLYRFEFGNPKN